ncbi:MAG: hypothetical protein NTU48_07360 [Legionellales bacterium]|nr:hypothetical protein [Legionellales bacterium]
MNFFEKINEDDWKKSRPAVDAYNARELAKTVEKSNGASLSTEDVQKISTAINNAQTALTPKPGCR